MTRVAFDPKASASSRGTPIALSFALGVWAFANRSVFSGPRRRRRVDGCERRLGGVSAHMRAALGRNRRVLGIRRDGSTWHWYDRRIELVVESCRRDWPRGRDRPCRRWGPQLRHPLGRGRSRVGETTTSAAPQRRCAPAFPAVLRRSRWPAYGKSPIAAGGDHTCAYLMAGTVECWADNSLGPRPLGVSYEKLRCSSLANGDDAIEQGALFCNMLRENGAGA
jgi:hypothetical protein